MHGFQPGHQVSDHGNVVLGGRAWRGRSRRVADYRGKRLFDVCFALLALFLLIPAFLIIALAVKASSPGPVFFRQARYGRRGNLFTIYKFRTMREREPSHETIQAEADDPRFTPIGAFLRRTSLDELPQFINVLKGEMSVVGPRPHAPLTMIGKVPYEDVVRDYGTRHAVRPGITGLAQISGHRGPIRDIDSARRRFELDIAYVARRSFGMDAAIIWRSFVSEFITGSGL